MSYETVGRNGTIIVADHGTEDGQRNYCETFRSDSRKIKREALENYTGAFIFFLSHVNAVVSRQKKIKLRRQVRKRRSQMTL